MHSWRTSRRTITFERPLIMGILNLTPDSFSDGGQITSVDVALRRAAALIEGGADILDVGAESTRPGSKRVNKNEEIKRSVPVIEAIASRFDIPISVDTTKSAVASTALAAGAEIINDVSGLRFDPTVADVAAGSGSGLILMHSRGDFETMHFQPPIDEIVSDVSAGLARSVNIAVERGVHRESIALDIGIGFGKTVEQNLELLAKLDKLISEFNEFPMLVGASRKSFIGAILGGVPPQARLNGSLAVAVVAIWNGAAMIRVHDARETAEAARVVEAIRKQL